jgi:hypothetical protein
LWGINVFLNMANHEGLNESIGLLDISIIHDMSLAFLARVDDERLLEVKEGYSLSLLAGHNFTIEQV